MTAMRSLFAGILVIVVASSVVAACAADKTASGVDQGTGVDSGVEAGVEGANDASPSEVETGASVLTPTKATSAQVVINGVTRTLERAQFGVTKSDGSLYIEAHEGGVAACPETETPKRTLIISGVTKGAPGQTFTKSDGVTVSLLDFTGDQITSTPPSAKATAATITIVALDGEASVEIEVDATFAEGTAKGRVYATYCAAMSE